MKDDRDCWKRISQGDEVVFDRFYRENAPRLQVFLRYLVGSSQAAEDLTQDTFTQIWNRPVGYEPDRGSLRAYLFGIGRKRALEWWRKQRPTGAVEEAELSAAEKRLCVMETSSMVGDVFRRLPEEQRALLWLREVEGQSYAELAVILDVPMGTVRSRLFAAREALRRIWVDGANERKETA